MADDLTIDNGGLTDYDVATDDDGSGNHVQIVKLAQAADGSRTPIPADSDGMLVNLGANNDVTVTGTVDLGAVDNAVLDAIAALLTTIDADTGNLSAILTALQIIDDWDESDRAKVNLIAGQAGITAGAGNVAANTPRVTLAADDPAVVDLAAIEALLTTIDVDTGNLAAMLTALQLIDNIVLAEDAVHGSGDPGVQILAVRKDTSSTGIGANGDYVPLAVNASGHLYVVEASAANALTALQLIDNASVNHDAAAVAGVTQIGLDARSSDPTAVASADATRALATLIGKQVVMPYAIPARTWQYASVSGGVTDTADDAAVAAGGAGVRHYITHVDVVNAHATVGTEVVIKSASTVIWRGYAPAGGGGISAEFPTPLRGGANEAINVTNITTGAATYFNLTGFTAAE